MVGVVYHQQNIVIAQGVDDPVFGQFAGAVDIIIGKKTGPAGAYGDQQIAGEGFLPRLWHHQDDIGNAEPAIGVAAVNGGKAGSIHPKIRGQPLGGGVLYPHDGNIEVDGIQGIRDPFAGGGGLAVIIRLRQRVRLLEALQDKQHHHQQRSHNDDQLAHGKAPSFPVLVFPKYSGYRPPLSRKRGCFSQIVQLCEIFRPWQAARQRAKLAQKAPPSAGIFLGQSQPRTRAPRSPLYQISSRLSALRSLLQRYS